LFLGLFGGAGLLAAQAATAAPAASSVCSKVSAASVSAIVGRSVPAPTTDTRTLPPTKENFGISAVVTTCTYGTSSSLAALVKDVTLQIEVTSKPITIAEIKQTLLKLSTASLKITLNSYSGLGVPALYFTTTGAGIKGQGISGVDGTRIYGASVEQPLSESKLASLAKLAKNL
jgi:hypothetical protein